MSIPFEVSRGCSLVTRIKRFEIIDDVYVEVLVAYTHDNMRIMWKLGYNRFELVFNKITDFNKFLDNVGYLYQTCINTDLQESDGSVYFDCDHPYDIRIYKSSDNRLVCIVGNGSEGSLCSNRWDKLLDSLNRVTFNPEFYNPKYPLLPIFGQINARSSDVTPV